MSVLFQLGRLLITARANSDLEAAEVREALRRHQLGDWGELCEEDRAENDASVIEGRRLFSAYTARDGTKFWVITEADRSSTTVLLPDDY